jgi:prepilin peptidase CpaA
MAIVAVALAASAWDVRTRRIPNALVFGAAIAGVLWAVAEGPAAMLSSVLGWLVGLAVFFPLFALGGLGAGDVKLLAAFGAWLGPAGAIAAALWAALIGGVMATGVAAARGYLRQALRNLGAAIGLWLVVGPSTVPGMTLRDNDGPRLAYALPIGLGALVALWRAQQ